MNGVCAYGESSNNECTVTEVSSWSGVSVTVVVGRMMSQSSGRREEGEEGEEGGEKRDRGIGMMEMMRKEKDEVKHS